MLLLEWKCAGLLIVMAVTVAGVGAGCWCSGKNQVLSAKAGAIDALVAVMRAHVGGDAGVLVQVCEAIGRLCKYNGAWSWRRWRAA